MPPMRQYSLIFFLSKFAPSELAAHRTSGAAVPTCFQETVTPGLSSTTSTSGASFCRSPGLPVNRGNVPKCMGMTVFRLEQLASVRGVARRRGVLIVDRQRDCVGG